MKRLFSRVAIVAALTLLFPSARAVILPVAEDTSSTIAGKINPATGKAATLPVTAKEQAFLIFDLSKLPVSVTAATLSSARLNLYLSSLSAAGDLTVHQVTNEWRENTASISAPGYSSGVVGTIAAGSLAAKNFIEVDVTVAVSNWLNGQSNFGFAITTVSGNVRLASKEGVGTGFPALLEIDTADAVLLNASQLTNGTLPLTTLPGVVVTNGEMGVSLTGTFGGDGSGLTKLPGVQLTQGLGMLTTVTPVTAPIQPVYWLDAAFASNYSVGNNVTNLSQFTNTVNPPVLAHDPLIGNYLLFNGSEKLVSVNNLLATNALTVIWLSKANIYSPGVDWSLLGRNDVGGNSLYSMRNAGHILVGANTATVNVGASAPQDNWVVNSFTFDVNSNMTVKTSAEYLSTGTTAVGANLGSFLPMQIGTGQGFGWNGGIAEVAVWTNVLDPVTLQQQELAMLNRHGLFPRNKIWFVGDSIIADQQSGGTNYQQQVMAALNNTRYVEEADGLAARPLSSMALTNVVGFQNWGFTPLVVVSGGVNDLNLGVTASNLLIIASNICSFYRARGAYVVYVDPTPYASPTGTTITGFNVQRTNFIAMVKTTWPNWADGFADIGSDPTYATQAASSNTVYYPDGIHPSPTVSIALAPYITAAVKTIFP